MQSYEELKRSKNNIILKKVGSTYEELLSAKLWFDEMLNNPEYRNCDDQIYVKRIIAAIEFSLKELKGIK